MKTLQYVLILMFAVVPMFVSAEDITVTGTINTSFSRSGVFGCSQTGSYSMSVGALSAVGGAYVPVNDAAVTLNTGYLVYKECVLRGVVDRMRENATANLQRAILVAYQRGRNGQPLFSQSIPLESRAVTDKAVLDYLQGDQVNMLNPTLRGPVARAIAQGYMATRNTPGRTFSCNYTGNLNALYSGNPDGSVWAGLSAIQTPGCDPIFAYNLSNEQALGSAGYAVDNMLTRLGWDNGNYPLMGTDADGNPIVLTPGSVVGANALQALQSGFTQLQNANDIDQMVGALFAGITSQVVNDNKGLVGLTKPTGGQASYLDQVVAQSAQGLRDSAINAGIQILVAQQQLETQILTLAQSILTEITRVSKLLRDRENACWTLIISKVCATPLKSDNTCTAVSGACTPDPTNPAGPPTCPTDTTLQVATTTYQFAQKVIDAQFTPYQQIHQSLASTTQNTLTRVAQLIAQLTDTSSYTAQLEALQGLDRLIAQGVTLHKPQDVANEQGAVSTLVGQNGGTGTLYGWYTDTAGDAGAWLTSTDPTTGWCNVNNPAVITMWIQRWKK